jgi:hypothetical protein
VKTSAIKPPMTMPAIDIAFSIGPGPLTNGLVDVPTIANCQKPVSKL